MQEEVTQKTIALTVQATKLTGRTLFKMIGMYLRHRKNKGANPNIKTGKQSVKNLVKQGQSTNSLDINDVDAKIFHRTMKKYGIDYAVMTDKKSTPPTHTILFKAKDDHTMTVAFTDFTAQITKNKSRPSVLAEIKKLTALVKNMVVQKVKNKEQTR